MGMEKACVGFLDNLSRGGTPFSLDRTRRIAYNSIERDPVIGHTEFFPCSLCVIIFTSEF